ncbi:ribosome maturation factor RimP [Halorhodospira halochloris]|uniref:Ribosome maturation factor RimP n=1 Tax=Halorhodospira halochloris TaxID=1052 RepID=A0A0X8X999_HALHR|nr:ribosome maturation factor RimP [Halorhodospira halochloris]MBK1652504.1 ribosome maturation factor RimP [Halorhodospira halochloris]MCG5530624.1 ribosome maturation factor RimP [Halorhodospira halochloris]BAU57826.1 clustered with transcription termination protein NusA [Halorhodospira halochloris]
MAEIQTLHALLEPTVEGLGYELVGVEMTGAKGNLTLRLYIDTPAGIRLEDCEAVSHQVSGLLDVEDPIPGAYSLEVSSPGLDRPIFKVADYDRFSGERVKLRLHELYEGRRKLTGRLLGIEGDRIKVQEEGDGQEYSIPIELIEKARLDLEP